MSEKPIDTSLQDEELFYPLESFRSSAHVHSDKIYEEAKKDFEGFWASAAKGLDWFKSWKRVLEWNPPFAKWFWKVRSMPVITVLTATYPAGDETKLP